MNYETPKKNQVYLKGEIVCEATFAREVCGEKFYELFIKVMRLSGNVDVLPITISERLIQDGTLEVGKTICINGQFRSYNMFENGKSRLMLTVFVRELLDELPEKNTNIIHFNGYICKPPVYRITPFNREVTDLLIAVNRAYNKTDYIPCIAWGRNARFANTFSVGDKIEISGRIQSREYQKKISETEIKTMTAYEVSISWLSVLDTEDCFEVDCDDERDAACL